MKRLLLPILLLATLAACRDRQPGTDAAPAATDAPAAADAAASAGEPADARVVDVMETGTGYIIGISYPPEVQRWPGLAVELKRYSDAAREELMAAVAGAGPEGPSMPYDLALPFVLVHESPALVTVKAEGSVYTGGAHGAPLVARFNWLPGEKRLLHARELVAGDDGWDDIARYVRESLHAALSQRIEADEPDAEERARLVRSVGRMIDEGTGAEAGNFEQFEPVPAADGRLRALRFVFPPYQVGPYSDGVQTVEVPASVLLPHLAPAYRALFTTG
jgi:hypothetical protein